MLWNIVIVHLLGLMSPGPDFFYIARTAALYGRKTALFAVAGIVCGVMFWACATMLGLSLLFNTFPLLNAVLVCLGAAYLMYLGSKMLKTRENVQFQEYAPDAATAVRPWQEAKKGLLVNLSNPKVVVYFGSVMSAVLADMASERQMAGVLLLLLVETAAYFALIAFLFSGGAVKLFYSRYGRYVDNVSGCFFIGFGIYLIFRTFA
ncbi:LysE family transporter [Neisseria lisongii]|uniref:LysE family transporter n=1 Tax=Neisseria lisongii TaxID=2912188 RepID=A0AAW5AP93_9NEIS|nr:LysE family transporter [Neisseria lisongii]MCF7528850.1 LysE family transporter [Neisseria lisongii]